MKATLEQITALRQAKVTAREAKDAAVEAHHQSMRDLDAAYLTLCPFEVGQRVEVRAYNGRNRNSWAEAEIVKIEPREPMVWDRFQEGPSLDDVDFLLFVRPLNRDGTLSKASPTSYYLGNGRVRLGGAS